MFLITQFVVFLVSGYQIYPNLGLVLSPNNGIFTFDAFAHVKTSLEVNFEAIENFDRMYETLKCNSIMEESGLKNNEKNKLQIKLDDQMNVTGKLRQRTLATTFYHVVVIKFKDFGFDLHVGKQIINKIDILNVTRPAVRERRQFGEGLIALGGAAIGLTGEWMIHKIFGLGHNHEVTEIKSDLNAKEKLRSQQASAIQQQILKLKCRINNDFVEQYRRATLDLIHEELDGLDNILMALKYGIVLNSKVYFLMVQSCLRAVMNEALCDQIIKHQKFVVSVDKIIILDHKIEFKLDFIFPTVIFKRTAITIFNFGIMKNDTGSIIGERISSLRSINTVLMENMVGFNTNVCTKMDSFYLCSSELIMSNTLSQDHCLNSIFANKTTNCLTETFVSHRTCAIHAINDHILISAAIPYTLLTTITNADKKSEIIRTNGKAGLYPVETAPELSMVTLICGNISKILTTRPLVNNRTYEIYLEPTIFNPLNTFNFSSLFNNDYQFEQLMNEIIHSDLIQGSSTGIMYILIFCCLIFVILIFMLLYRYIKRCCTKIAVVQVV